MDMGRTSTLKKVPRQRAPGRHKGVRMRAWGRWVSEIRLPKSGIKIWFGTYDALDQAARAYDAAVYCIHGASAEFNFPENKRPVPPTSSAVHVKMKDIQAIATYFSSADVSVSTLVSSTMITQVPSDKPASPNLLISTGMATDYEVDCGSFAPSCATGAAVTSPENLQLDDFLMLDTGWIAEFY